MSALIQYLPLAFINSPAWIKASNGYRQVFQAMFYRASLDQQDQYHRGVTVTLQPGEICASEREIAGWCWPLKRSMVQRCIAYFIKLNVISSRPVSDDGESSLSRGQIFKIDFTEFDPQNIFSNQNLRPQNISSNQNLAGVSSPKKGVQKNSSTQNLEPQNKFSNQNVDLDENALKNPDSPPVPCPPFPPLSLDNPYPPYIPPIPTPPMHLSNSIYPPHEDLDMAKSKSTSPAAATQKASQRLKTDLCKIFFRECVDMTQEDYDKLVQRLPSDQLEWMLDKLDFYIASSGKVYKSHYALFKNGSWLVAEWLKHAAKSPKQRETTNLIDINDINPHY